MSLFQFEPFLKRSRAWVFHIAHPSHSPCGILLTRSSKPAAAKTIAPARTRLTADGHRVRGWPASPFRQRRYQRAGTANADSTVNIGRRNRTKIKEQKPRPTPGASAHLK